MEREHISIEISRLEIFTNATLREVPWRPLVSMITSSLVVHRVAGAINWLAVFTRSEFAERFAAEKRSAFGDPTSSSKRCLRPLAF